MKIISATDQFGLVSALGIELIELETFLVVAEKASFSLAAEYLHVTQPSVTGRIQRLESALAIKLFERTTRRVELTPQGLLLATEATNALANLRKLIGQFSKEAKLARQRVIVAATPMLAALSLPPVIRAYSERFPDVQVELRDLQYPDALTALDTGAADLAILAIEDRKNRRYRSEHLWTDNMVLVVPDDHILAQCPKVGAAELSTLSLLMVEQYHPVVVRLAKALEEQGLKLPLPKTVENSHTVLGMLNVRIGATILPLTMASRCHDSTSINIDIKGLDLSRRYGLVTSRKAEMSTAAISFAKFVRSTMQNSAVLDDKSEGDQR